MGTWIGVVIGAFWMLMVMWFTVDGQDLNKINAACNLNGGVEKFTIEIGRTKVYCKDGAEFRIKE